MSDKPNCKWCGFNYSAIKQGREYLYHEESFCEKMWLKRTLCRLLRASDDHMTACDRTMGATHPCTCGANDARKMLIGDL